MFYRSILLLSSTIFLSPFLSVRFDKTFLISLFCSFKKHILILVTAVLATLVEPKSLLILHFFLEPTFQICEFRQSWKSKARLIYPLIVIFSICHFFNAFCLTACQSLLLDSSRLHKRLPFLQCSALNFSSYYFITNILT